ncbi:MAG TPA: ABC transporter permease [Longimicrobiales bacterium]|nr:ABC transporter permease [Longimicrobiales bacterium]
MYTIREALAAFRRAPLLTGLSAAMIALSIFVVGLFGVAAHNVRLVLDRVESRVEVVAYLRDDAAAASVNVARQDLSRLPEVREVLYISREQALADAREELPDFQAIFADLDVNPLPASFEIRLHPGRQDPATVQRVADAVGAYPFVEDVRFGREWLDKVFVLRRVAAAATAVLGFTFAAVAALIIGAAVRIAIFARRDEIAIMRLVGATDGFIRRPFVLEGLLTGALGAALALAGTWAIYRVLSDSIFRLEWLPPEWVLAGLGLGVVLGVLASTAAVHRYLRDV